MHLRDYINRLFPEKFNGEDVVYICRRHKVLLLVDEIKVLFALAIIVAIPAILNKYEINYIDKHKNIFTIFYIASLAFILLSFYAKYYNWKYDLYIITNQRIIDSNRYFPFRKVFTEAELGKVQDSTYYVPGALGYFFRFGNLRIETAGESANFEWSGIPNPSTAQRILRQTIEAVNGDAGYDL